MRLGAFYKPLQLLSIHRRYNHASSFSHIKENLLSRPPNIIKDSLDPENSKILNSILSSILPIEVTKRIGNVRIPGLRSKHWHFFPQGHHLVYFPPGIPRSQLLFDGTDTLHYPGDPFIHRMWAGGSVTFNNTDPLFERSYERRHEQQGILHPATCVEKIQNVEVKGLPKKEKMFVEIERHIRGRTLVTERKLDEEPFSILETRTLVFMRAKDGDEIASQSTMDRFVKPPHTPDFKARFIPTQSLLLRFSRLSRNHHKIHLSPKYAWQVEGYRNLLVHGPLTLILMLSVLQSQLEKGEMVSTLNYKNLAPLYVNEKMAICGKRKLDGTFTIWIEDSRGSLAVKAEASVTVEAFHSKFVTRDIAINSSKSQREQFRMRKVLLGEEMQPLQSNLSNPFLRQMQTEFLHTTLSSVTEKYKQGKEEEKSKCHAANFSEQGFERLENRIVDEKIAKKIEKREIEETPKILVRYHGSTSDKYAPNKIRALSIHRKSKGLSPRSILGGTLFPASPRITFPDSEDKRPRQESHKERRISKMRRLNQARASNYPRLWRPIYITNSRRVSFVQANVERESYLRYLKNLIRKGKSLEGSETTKVTKSEEVLKREKGEDLKLVNELASMFGTSGAKSKGD